MKLTKRKKSIDSGKKYGLGKTVSKITIDHNDAELAPIVNSIKKISKKERILVGDWGGGNGLLAKDLLLKLFNHDVKIVIIDDDFEKFIDFPHINNIFGDIKTYAPKINFDYSMARNVLHYMPLKDQQRFIKNIVKHTQKEILVINYVYPALQSKRFREFERKLKKHAGVERRFPTRNEIVAMIKKTKAIVVKESKIVIKNFDYEKFFIARFNLTNSVIAKLKPSVVLEKGDYTISVMYVKK